MVVAGKPAESEDEKGQDGGFDSPQVHHQDISTSILLMGLTGFDWV